jgi:serine/threonine-protein kinase HipA
MRYPLLQKLDVRYRGKPVGVLSSLRDGRLAFAYQETWLAEGFSISPFSLPLSKGPFFVKKNTFDGLFGVFDDSLPDHWGRLLFLRRSLADAVDYEKRPPLTKLALLSSHSKGALSYFPFFGADSSDFPCGDWDFLSSEYPAFYREGPLPKDFDAWVDQGASLGGASPKVNYRDEGGEWIVKFPMDQKDKDFGLREYQTNVLAKKAGIAVNEFRLFPSRKTPGYFGAKRFDRKDGEPLHMISLSGLLEVSHETPVLDYVHLFQAIQKVCKSRSDLLEAYRRMVFNVLVENKDDHGKNFAFLYDEAEKRYRLSPAYDLTRTPNRYGHEMSVNGKDNPTEEDCLAAARYVGIRLGEAKRIFDEVASALRP